MNEVGSAYEQALEHVCETENFYLTNLFLDLQFYLDHGNKCGCPNCLKKITGIQELIADEVERLTPETPKVLARVCDTQKSLQEMPSSYDPFDESDRP